MDDRSNKAYASLPERLYVVQDGQVVYQVAQLFFVVAVMLRHCTTHNIRVVWAHLTTGLEMSKTS